MGRLMAEVACGEVALHLGYTDTDSASQSALQSRLHNDNYAKVALVRGSAPCASEHIKEHRVLGSLIDYALSLRPPEDMQSFSTSSPLGNKQTLSNPLKCFLSSF